MAGPPPGRPLEARSGSAARGLLPLPPVPPSRPPVRHRPDPLAPDPLAPDPLAPDPIDTGPIHTGPLVTGRSADPAPRPERRRGSRLGRFVRRFVGRWGWRAYAIPLLAVATVLTVVDLLGPAADAPARTGATAGAAAPAGTALATSTAAPTSAAPAAPAEGDAAPPDLPAPTASGTYAERGAGTVTVVPGTSAVQGTGPLQRFVVEVEDGIGVDGAAFAAAVEDTLGDPRSWGGGGRLSFQRVGETEAGAGAYEFRVSLVSPGSMERYCPGVGTGGYTSCRYGERAVINLARWETAVPDYEGDVATYRQYVVNHEVGHALGNGHQRCPGAGQAAPVMQQQTLGLEGCAKNAWPYP